MTRRKLLALLPIIIFFVVAWQGQAPARRIFQTFTDPATPCVRGSVFYHMLTDKFLICTNNGPEEVGVGESGGVIPIADANTTGRLLNTDWTLFNNKQNPLGFTPENTANKNAPNGYAGLIGGKIQLTNVSEVLPITGLTDYSTTSGSGSTAIKATISAVGTNEVLTWDGTNWVNDTLLVTSVFGRTGDIIAQSGDYTAAQVTNSFNTSIANTLINVVAPSNPSAGNLAVWADSTDTILKVKNSSGTVAITVKPNTCSGTDKVSSITSAGLVVCTADQSGGGGSGITELNGLTATDQNFSTTNDTNMSLTINSVTDTHSFILNWIGTLSKSRMVPTTVHTDQINTFGAFAQSFQAGANFNLLDPTNTTKVARFDLSNISGASTRTVNIPDANSTTIQSSTAPSNNFATGISGQGVISYAQPSFSNLSGSATDAQIPDAHSITAISNQTSNGFVKTSAGNGTLIIDSSTYLTANQTITLSGNVTGSGTTSISTTIANNVVTGAMIALGSDAQGDILYYNGTDYVRLAAGTSGQLLQTQGAGANPIWATIPSGGDMVLASVQTVTGAKTFDPTKLIIGSVSSDPAVVIGSFYRDTDDGKLYFGVDSTVDFWGEVFISGQSTVNLATSNVTGILPTANGGFGVVLSDPNADRLLFWDDSAGQYQFLTLGTGLSITGTTINATGGGSGDFVGPSSSTDNAIVRFDSTTGKLGQNSVVTIDDSGNISTPGTLTVGAGGSTAGTIQLSSTGGAFDSGFTAIAAGVLKISDGSSGLGFLQQAGRCFLASDQTNATTTMANVTGCSVTVVSGRKYTFRAILYLSDSVAADGVKIDFDGGTATATNFRVHCTGFDSALNPSTQTTALATDITSSTFTGSGMFDCRGTFEPSANGTFIPRIAQNAHTTGTLTLARGSHVTFEDMP